MKRFIALLLCLIIVCIPAASFAHSGGTDANGGHYDHSTGEYHYHHGYPAHQHYGGKCPYEDQSAGFDTDFERPDYDQADWAGVSKPKHLATRFVEDSPLEKVYYEGYDDGYLTGYKKGEETGYDNGWNSAAPLVPAWCFVVMGILVLMMVILIIKLVKIKKNVSETGY